MEALHHREQARQLAGIEPRPHLHTPADLRLDRERLPGLRFSGCSRATVTSTKEVLSEVLESARHLRHQ